MQLPPFVFLNSKDLPGTEFLLHTRAPYTLARAFKFEDATQYENFIKKYNLLNSCGVVPGYYILICLVGTIESVSEPVVLGHNVKPDQLNIINNLTTFYENERIKGNETRLKKFVR